MSEGSRMKATVVSLTKKKGMSWGMADLSMVYCTLVSNLSVGTLRPGLGFDLTICCGPTSVFLFWLATRAGRAIADGRTAVGARKAALAKGRRKRVFMMGFLEVRVSALQRRDDSNWAQWSLSGCD
jgi:hypothetical protein